MAKTWITQPHSYAEIVITTSLGHGCWRFTLLVIIFMHIQTTHYFYQSSGPRCGFLHESFKMCGHCNCQINVGAVRMFTLSSLQTMTWCHIAFGMFFYHDHGFSSIPNQPQVFHNANKVI